MDLNAYINMYILKFQQLKYHADRNCGLNVIAEAFVLLWYDSFHLGTFCCFILFCLGISLNLKNLILVSVVKQTSATHSLGSQSTPCSCMAQEKERTAEKIQFSPSAGYF